MFADVAIRLRRTLYSTFFRALIFLFGCVALIVVTSCAKKPVNPNGVYMGVSASESNVMLRKTPMLESLFDRSLDWVSVSLDWNAVFPRSFSTSVLAQGGVPLIYWEPWVWNDSESIHPQHILDGDWDGYLDQWADACRSFEFPIFIVLAPRFNDPTLSWNTVSDSYSPDQYIDVYHYVVEHFRDKGALNIRWVWMVDADSTGAIDDWTLAYPGDDYVDWTAIWISVLSGDSETIVDKAAKKLHSNSPSKPIIVSLNSSSTKGHDIFVFERMLKWVLTYDPPIKGIIWEDNRLFDTELAPSLAPIIDFWNTQLDSELFNTNIDRI